MVNLSAVEARAQDSAFVDQCNLWGLQGRLPLRWPTPSHVPPSPKRRYRSHYAYQGGDDLPDLAAWAHLSDFDLVLRLMDFSGLRPVLAQRLGWTSPHCETLACADACRYATPWDAEARFVWYTGSNQPQSSPNRPTEAANNNKKDGKPCYGYRSLPLLLADPNRRFHLTLLVDFLAANEREEVPGTALLRQLPCFYPDLRLDTVAGDAGFGYEVFLHAVYTLGARRVVDLRAHSTDRDKAEWLVRGYDDRGRPVCPYGYAFTANGFDARRQRYKWFCGQACLHDAEPLVSLAEVRYPPHECPHRKPTRPYGQILNLGERFANDSIRLVRDVPVGSTAWKRLYHRARNASEARNATFEHWDLKRLPVYGGLRGKALIYLADTWATLTTLARLVREATFATA